VEADAIFKTVERFREQLAAQQFELGFERVSITASFGIAGLNDKENIDFTGLLRRADQALYAAKNAGRNLIRTEPEQAK
jgi:diguanylate cyclase (GGDEF)-like protein